MKRKLFTRVLCLLLCFSMVMPAAATGLPGTDIYGPRQPGASRMPESDSVVFTLTNGETTKQMAYVDQFYNHDGSFSTMGDKLLTWLDMTPTAKPDDPARTNSGYLMLEQEMKHQKSLGYNAANVYIRAARGVGNIVSLNFIVDILSKDQFEKKFPDADQEAYVYYTILFDSLVQYVASMQAALEETGINLSEAAQLVGDLYSLSVDLGLTEGLGQVLNKPINILFGRIKKTELFVLSMFGSGKPVKVRVTEVEDSAKMFYKMEWVSRGVKYQKTGSATDVIKEFANGKQNIIMDFTPLKGAARIQAAADFETGMKKMKIPSPNSHTVNQVSAKHVSGFFESVAEAADEADLNREETQALIYCSKSTDFSADKKINVPKYLEKLGDVMDCVEIVTGFFSYAQDKENLTTRQLSYYNALSQVSADYLQMLLQWEAAVEESSLPSWEKEKLMTAIAAVWAEGIRIHDAAKEDLDQIMEEMAQEEAKIFASRGFFDALKSVATAGFSQKFLKNFAIKAWNKVSPGVMKVMGGVVTKATTVISSKIAAVKNSATATKNVAAAGKTSLFGVATKVTFGTFTAATSIGTTVLDWLVAGAFIDFGDKTEAIHNMKLTLCDYLTNEKNGLLYRYARLRTHETACLIIEALNTMKQLKIKGEDVIEEFYLRDFYDHFDVETNGATHVVFYNEIVNRNGKLDIPDYITPIYGVYQRGNDTDESYAYTTLGYYLVNNGDTAAYKDVPLKRLPTHLSQFDRDEGPDTDETPQVPADQWMKQQTVTTSSEKVVISKRMLYSRDGVDMVLTMEEYQQLLELQDAYNDLDRLYGDTSTIDWEKWEENHSQKEGKEQQYYERLRWLRITRTWIENVKMFDIEATYPIY